MTRLLFALIAIFLLNLPSGHAAQQDVERIAAVVNDQVVSMYDLNGRMRLVLVSSGLPDTPETRQRLTPAVLRSLIDETLQLQEAKRLNINIGAAEIENAIKRIAQQNDMSEPQFQKFLTIENVPLPSLIAQVRAGIAWSKIVAQRIRPTIEIGDDQVEEYLKRVKESEDKPQYHLMEIFLAVDSSQQDDEVKRTAERLAEQIKKGANFVALARQFSQSATAAVGGDMGWVQQGSLDPELEKVVQRMKAGEISAPVRTVSGYHLLLLRDRRQGQTSAAANVEFELEHFFLQAPPKATPSDLGSLRSVAQAVSENAKDCDDFEKLRKELPDARTVLPIKVAAKDLAPVLQAVALKLPVGKASEPITLNNGVFVMMICRRSGDPGTPNSEEVRTRLGEAKLDLLTRRYLRDLRTAAFVDVRA